MPCWDVHSSCWCQLKWCVHSAAWMVLSPAGDDACSCACCRRAQGSCAAGYDATCWHVACCSTEQQTSSTPGHCTCMHVTWVDPAGQHTVGQHLLQHILSVCEWLATIGCNRKPICECELCPNSTVHTAAEPHCLALSSRNVQPKPLQQRQWMHPLSSRQHNTQHKVHSPVRL